MHNSLKDQLADSFGLLQDTDPPTCRGSEIVGFGQERSEKMPRVDAGSRPGFPFEKPGERDSVSLLDGRLGEQRFDFRQS